MAAGDFQGLGRDQLLASYQFFCNSCQAYSENIVMFIFAPSGGWTQRLIDTDDYPLAAMAAGDVNHDGLDDAVIVLGSGDRPILAIFAGPDLSNNPPLFVDGPYCSPWPDVKVGNMNTNPSGPDTNHPGDEIVLSRIQDFYPCYNSIDFEYWNSGNGTLENWGSSPDYVFQPAFSKLALGDIDGDIGHDDEVFALRTPTSQGQAYLELISPGNTLPRTGIWRPAITPTGRRSRPAT